MRGGVGDLRRTDDGDCGAQDVHRSEEADRAPLMLVEEGERANEQNENGEGVVADGSRLASERASGLGPAESAGGGLHNRDAGESGPTEDSKAEKQRIMQERLKREQERRACENVEKGQCES